MCVCVCVCVRVCVCVWDGGITQIGVGAFVFANGLVTPMTSTPKGLFGALRSAGPLLVLGAGRLVSIKASGYPEHVSEYGVHWNFFLTLAAVSAPHTTRSRLLMLLISRLYTIEGIVTCECAHTPATCR